MERLMTVRSFLTPVCIVAAQHRFAGHAKWQNIAHTKSANDQRRAKIVAKQCTVIRKTMAHGASTDPKVNDALRNAISYALKCNVPKATIERQIERAKNMVLKKETIEVAGPGGSLFMIEVETDNIGVTRNTIKKVLRKVKGVGMAVPTVARMSFEERGVIVIGKKDTTGKVIDKERAEEIAIEAGAEDVVDTNQDQELEGDRGQEETGGSDVIGEEDSWTLYTGKMDFHGVKTALEKMPHVLIRDSEITFRPVTRIPLNPDDMTTAVSLTDALRDVEEVSIIYDNIKYD